MSLLNSPLQSENAFKGKIGEIVEYKAVAWLLSVGYEVYKNVTYHGPIDIIAIEPLTGWIRKIDVKKITDASRPYTKISHPKLSDAQNALGVEMLYYDEIKDQFHWSTKSVYESHGKIKRDQPIAQPKAVVVKGFQFDSLSKAADHFNVSLSRLSAWLIRNPSKTVTAGVEAIRNQDEERRKGVVVNGIRYNSKRDATSKLNLSHRVVEYWHLEKHLSFEDAINKAIERQSID